MLFLQVRDEHLYRFIQECLADEVRIEIYHDDAAVLLEHEEYVIRNVTDVVAEGTGRGVAA